MNKDQLKKRIDDLQAELARLKAKANETERWKPETGEWYLTVIDNLTVDKYTWSDGYDVQQHDMLKAGNVFPLEKREEVEAFAKQLRLHFAIFNKAMELDAFQEFSADAANYFIAIEPDGTLRKDFSSFYKFPSSVYFNSKEACAQAIEELTEEGWFNE